MMTDDALPRPNHLDRAAQNPAPSRPTPIPFADLPSGPRERRLVISMLIAGALLFLGAAMGGLGQTFADPAWILLIGLLAYAAAQGVRIYVRKYYLFLPDYVHWALTPAATSHRATHIFLLYADHFEPPDDSRMRRWAAEYEAMARRHQDADGRHPQHTWFYPVEQLPQDPHMERLQKLVADGFGEVEVHLHHNFDTPEGLEAKIRNGLAYFERFGFARTVDGQSRFAFVHGLSGLDNSNGASMCGVDRELEILKQLGCFADFTFPSVWEDSQPPFVNTIYEAVDDDGPKSYHKRRPETPLGTGDLTIFQGPLLLVPSFNPMRLFLEVEDGNIHPAKPATPRRVDRWIRANVHLPERPDWVFIKVFGHAVSSDGDRLETVGPNFDAALTYLEKRYNDGKHYVLHYVTAREAYNLARAAAAGLQGEPSEYYDWVVKPYVSSARRTHAPSGGVHL